MGGTVGAESRTDCRGGSSSSSSRSAFMAAAHVSTFSVSSGSHACAPAAEQTDAHKHGHRPCSIPSIEEAGLHYRTSPENEADCCISHGEGEPNERMFVHEWNFGFVNCSLPDLVANQVGRRPGQDRTLASLQYALMDAIRSEAGTS